MKNVWATTLTVLLGWLATQASAQDVLWRPAPPATPTVARPASPPFGVSLGQPVAGPPLPPASRPVSVEFVQVGRPSNSTAPAAPASPASGMKVTVIRAKCADPIPMELPAILPVKNGPDNPAASAAAQSTGPSLTDPDQPAAPPPPPPPPPPSGPPVPAAECAPGCPCCPGPACCPAPCCPGAACCTETACCPEQPVCDDVCSCTCESSYQGCQRFYASGEYLFWWVRGQNTPVLVTTGASSAPGRPDAGILGNPHTLVLFGGRELDNEPMSGGRFTAGYWLDCCQECGLEGTFFFLGERSDRFAANSRQFPVLARPFFNAATGRETAEFTTMPPRAVGGISVDAPTRLWGLEANVRDALCCGCWGRVDLLGGFRFVSLDEGLHVTENIFAPVAATAAAGRVVVPAGSNILVSDRFDTHNQFYGPQVGLAAQLRRGRWVLDLRAKVALGVNHEEIDVNGNQVIAAPGRRVAAFPGGLLAVPGNIGHHSRDRFAVVPEAGVTLGYQVTDNLRVFAGYNFLFMSNVVRPGDQIDRVIDPRRIPNFARLNPALAPLPRFVNPPRPLLPFLERSFWAQGINVGMELTY